MRRIPFLTVVAAAAVLLAGCGGTTSGSLVTSADVSSPEVSSPASSSSAQSSTASASTSSTAPSTTASSAVTSAGPAPDGAVIKGGSAGRLPTTVGVWTTGKSTSGPATFYNNDRGGVIGVSFLMGSDYDAIVEYIKSQQTRAGTGMCGTTTVPTSLVCYIESADGVYSITADTDDAPLTGLVAFVNQFTALLGTS